MWTIVRDNKDKVAWLNMNNGNFLDKFFYSIMRKIGGFPLQYSLEFLNRLIFLHGKLGGAGY